MGTASSDAHMSRCEQLIIKDTDDTSQQITYAHALEAVAGVALEVLRALVDDLVLDERRHHGGEQREKPEHERRTQREGASRAWRRPSQAAVPGKK